MAAQRNMQGFSLVELMVALVAGLIVVGAVLAFALSSVRANSDYISSTRLTQELRSTMEQAVEDIRRAGYDENALDYVSRPASFTGTSPFAKMFVNGAQNCVIYAYDREGGNAGAIDLANGEVRGLRLASRTVNGQSVGVVETVESSGTTWPACDGAAPSYASWPVACSAGSWCPLSDPTIVDITTFQVSNDRPLSAGVPGLIPGTAGSSVLPMQLRKYTLNLAGRLVNRPDGVRSISTGVRVRADCIRAAAATQCIAAPDGT